MSDKLFLQLIKTSETMKKTCNTILAEIDLSLGQAQILAYLYKKDGKKVTQKDIENEFSLSHATVNGFISRMEKKGLLMTHQDECDKRFKVVEPTKKTKNYYTLAAFQSKNLFKNIDEQLTQPEQEMLAALLGKLEKAVIQNIEQYIKNLNNANKERLQ